MKKKDLKKENECLGDEVTEMIAYTALLKVQNEDLSKMLDEAGIAKIATEVRAGHTVTVHYDLRSRLQLLIDKRAPCHQCFIGDYP